MTTSLRLRFFAATLATLATAGVAPAVATTQPYGGCKEGWQAPSSPGADDCRALGWTVNRFLVLDPHRVVRASRLPDCGSVTRGACSWNFTGGHPGGAFWINGVGHLQYVWPDNPTAHLPAGEPVPHTWRWITGEQADALAEGGSPHADRRAWQLCVYAVRYQQVRCPDGTHWATS